MAAFHMCVICFVWGKCGAAISVACKRLSALAYLGSKNWPCSFVHKHETTLKHLVITRVANSVYSKPNSSNFFQNRFKVFGWVYFYFFYFWFISEAFGLKFSVWFIYVILVYFQNKAMLTWSKIWFSGFKFWKLSRASGARII